MNFFCFSFEYGAANFFPSDSIIFGLKQSLGKNGSEITIATKIMRKLHRDEEKGLLMQYHSINIEKLPKRIKNEFSNITY